MLRRLGLFAPVRALNAAGVAVTAQRFNRPLPPAQPPMSAAQGEDWMDFTDDDFWFLDEMFEGRLEDPEFIPSHERELLEREGLDKKNGGDKK
jgi:hypothetical protein